MSEIPGVFLFAQVMTSISHYTMGKHLEHAIHIGTFDLQIRKMTKVLKIIHNFKHFSQMIMIAVFTEYLYHLLYGPSVPN